RTPLKSENLVRLRPRFQRSLLYPELLLLVFPNSSACLLTEDTISFNTQAELNVHTLCLSQERFREIFCNVYAGLISSLSCVDSVSRRHLVFTLQLLQSVTGWLIQCIRERKRLRECDQGACTCRIEICLQSPDLSSLSQREQFIVGLEEIRAYFKL